MTVLSPSCALALLDQASTATAIMPSTIITRPPTSIGTKLLPEAGSAGTTTIALLLLFSPLMVSSSAFDLPTTLQRCVRKHDVAAATKFELAVGRLLLPKSSSRCRRLFDSAKAVSGLKRSSCLSHCILPKSFAVPQQDAVPTRNTELKALCDPPCALDEMRFGLGWADLPGR